jgi:hypothetical protein
MFKRIDANDKSATRDNYMHILVHSTLGYTIALRIKIGATDIHTFKEIRSDALVVHDLKVTDYAIPIKENL